MGISTKSLALFSFSIQFLFIFSAHAQTCQELRIMVPAYFDPATSPQAWSSLNSAAAVLPNRVVAIANPANGPGSAAQPTYQSAFTTFQSSRGRVIGYVYSRYGNRTLSEVQADIDSWYRFYPSIGGIFIDEVPNTDGQQGYYQGLYNYVKSKNSSALVVNNPGTATLESYLIYNGSRVADVVCTFEGVGGATVTQSAWTKNYTRDNFLGLFYSVTDSDDNDNNDNDDVLDRAYRENFGWVYITNDGLPNPWDTIASYFSEVVNDIRDNEQCDD